jgi:PCFT/HCP family folate transporter-like MFS transporter 1/3
MLQVAYLVTIPTGVALGQILYTKTGESVAILFATNASLVVVALIYSALRLQWRSAPNMSITEKVPVSRFFCDFFDKNHLIQTIRAVIKKRPGHRRAYLVALLIAMALYTFQRGKNIYLISFDLIYCYPKTDNVTCPIQWWYTPVQYISITLLNDKKETRK